MIDVMQALRKINLVNAVQSFTDLPQRHGDLRYFRGSICDLKDLQTPSREDGRHEYFLLERHSQLPDARHREYQDGKVRNDVENRTRLKKGIEAKAMAPLHERIPDLLAWSTHNDFENGRDEITNQVTPDAEVASDIDKHVAFPSRCEDAKVLEQD